MRRMLRVTGEAGFSLLELVIVISITAAVLLLFVQGIRQAREGFNLRRAASTTMAELRRAQALSMAQNVNYIAEFVVASPGSLNIYRTKLATETCPEGMTQVSSTLCRRTITGEQWPATVAIDGPGTTFAACSAPASVANKCVTFQLLGAPNAGGTALLRAGNGTIVQVVVAAATGRVSVQRP